MVSKDIEELLEQKIRLLLRQILVSADGQYIAHLAQGVEALTSALRIVHQVNDYSI